MKNGTCPKCHSTNVFAKESELPQLTLNSRPVASLSYLCTDCGFFETYITDKEALSKIPVRAEKLGDWKKVK